MHTVPVNGADSTNKWFSLCVIFAMILQNSLLRVVAISFAVATVVELSRGEQDYRKGGKKEKVERHEDGTDSDSFYIAG